MSQQQAQTRVGYATASEAIKAGKATPGHLWCILSKESDRDGFALRPMFWEGPGEYQRCEFHDERGSVLVRLPDWQHLPEPSVIAAEAISARATGA